MSGCRAARSRRLVAVVLSAWSLVVASASAAESGARVRVDARLAEEIRDVVERVASMRGHTGARPLTAVRGPADPDAADRWRSVFAVEADRLAARGRAWSDLGIAESRAPARLLAALEADLDGVALDLSKRRLIVEPDLFSPEDFDPTAGDRRGSEMLLSTGIRPDEPLAAHAIAHWLDREASPPGELETTDALLARAAVEEGAANLVAVRYVFAQLGLADAVTDPSIGPDEVLGGRLVPNRFPGTFEAAALDFVYLDGFDAVVRAHRRGGFRAVDRLAALSRGTGDVWRDVDTDPRPEALEPLEGEGVVPDGLEEVDRDAIGAFGTFYWASVSTGKDNLALRVADGLRTDRLIRFEAPGQVEDGITVWRTAWRSDEAADLFERTVRRAWGDRAQADDADRFSLGDRSARLSREGRTVSLRIEPARSPPSPRAR